MDKPLDEYWRECYKERLMLRQLESAVFFIKKAISLSSCGSDLISLANLYQYMGEHRKALSIVQNFISNSFPNAFETIDGKKRFERLDEFVALLSIQAQALSRLKEHHSVIIMIDELETLANERFEYISNNVSGKSKKNLATFALHRGDAFEALESIDSAILWWKKAFELDSNCYEAFSKLFHKQRIEPSEIQWAIGLVDSPQLKEMYETEVSQFCNNDVESDSTDPGRVVARAAHLAKVSEYEVSLELCQSVLESDPFNDTVLVLEITNFFHLAMKSQLFYLAHQLVDNFPENCIAWFAIGSYYLLLRHFEKARAAFHKSTLLDSTFIGGWLGLGHTFAMQEESEQALNVYRNAARLFKASGAPYLFIGMEYLRTNQLGQAQVVLEKSLAQCPSDPFLLNELGVLYFRQNEFENAIRVLKNALENASISSIVYESILVNLGHTFRKMRQFDLAKQCFTRALSVKPFDHDTLTALGLTFHLMGDTSQAIDYYQKSSGPLTNVLLEQALVLESDRALNALRQ